MDISHLPRISLGEFPTPLQRLRRLGGLAGHDHFYIKRDDMTGLGLGGNKTRSLEFLLGHAIAEKADTVITGGGLQSNLCALTAAACARTGLRCILVHNDTPPAELRGNMLLNAILGAESRFMGKGNEAERDAVTQEVAREVRAAGGRPYVIDRGGSTPRGALGYVQAALELASQCRDMNLPVRHVGMVGAMGGTASGFIFGTAMLGHPFHVHIISVEYPGPVLYRILLDLCSRIESLVGFATKTPVEEVMTVYDEYLGPGYAVPTAMSRQALFDLARREGVLCEDVYTSKTLGGFLDLITRGTIPVTEAACYVHTGGLGSLFAQDIRPR